MTLFTELQNAGLPVISATDDGAVQMGSMTFEQQIQFANVILAHFYPLIYQDFQTENANIQQMKTEYVNTIATLQTIEDTVSPTNAQVISAVKFLSKTVRLMLKLLAWLHR